MAPELDGQDGGIFVRSTGTSTSNNDTSAAACWAPICTDATSAPAGRDSPTPAYLHTSAASVPAGNSGGWWAGGLGPRNGSGPRPVFVDGHGENPPVITPDACDAAAAAFDTVVDELLIAGAAWGTFDRHAEHVTPRTANSTATDAGCALIGALERHNLNTSSRAPSNITQRLATCGAHRSATTPEARHRGWLVRSAERQSTRKADLVRVSCCIFQTVASKDGVERSSGSAGAPQEVVAAPLPAARVPRRKTPPRPLAVGDIVTGYSRHLGEWTVAQITNLDAARATAGVLDLDWSGPRPSTVEDLGDVKPLVLGHPSHLARVSCRNVTWLLPRGCHVIGQLPLMVDTPSNRYGGWVLGFQLALRRRSAAGHRGNWSDPSELVLSGADAAKIFSRQGQARLDIVALRVHSIDELDCQPLVERFPNLVQLQLHGQLGTLHNAGHLNSLHALRSLSIYDLFGMTAGEVLEPTKAPELEMLDLSSIPKEYADASRARWRKEIKHGTDVTITSARTPGWVAENRDNPLRDWDGNEHVSRAIYTKSIAQYKLTRSAVQASLARHLDPDELHQIGRDYGLAFNKMNARSTFIETIEREDLCAALDIIAKELAETSAVETVKAALQKGTDAVRDW